MADREKVIKGLEILMNGCEYIDCDDCCFYISTKPTRCGLREEQIQEEALALLKEQEAVEPTWQQGKAYCGSCGRRIPLKIGARFCHKCGQAVKWE